MTEAAERIVIDGKSYERFIPYPRLVKDGTARCFVCGQIDEPEYHTLTCDEALERARPEA